MATRQKAKAPTPRKRTAKRSAAARKASDPTNGVGRPSILTPELTAEFVRYLERGNYMVTVARHLGVGESTVYEWMDRGRKELQRIAATGEDCSETEERYVEFLQAVDRADVRIEVAAEGVLAGLLSADHEPEVRRRAAVDLLERRYRKRWSRGDHAEVTVTGTQRIELTIEEQQRRAETIIGGIVEVDAIAALQAQRRLDEGGFVDDDDG